MSLSPKLVEKTGLHLLGQVAKMARGPARSMLLDMQKFSSTEIDEILTLCKHTQGEVTAKQLGYFDKRRRAMAILWKLGVSWAQIAALYEVTRQTAMQSANKVLGGDRSRLATRCPYERASEYNTEFWRLDTEEEGFRDASLEDQTVRVSQAETDND